MLAVPVYGLSLTFQVDLRVCFLSCTCRKEEASQQKQQQLGLTLKCPVLFLLLKACRARSPDLELPFPTRLYSTRLVTY